MTFPTFDEFYQCVHGRQPFPWQHALANRLAAGGGWPQEIGVPTGLGKTSCLDIAVWWMARDAAANGPVRSAPTRIWWVVNRRLLVDSTETHASRLSELLASASDGPLRAVADALRSMAADPDAVPLEVHRLRGAVPGSRPTDPSQPAVILSTVPKFGSRLLFRGYGSSRSMRPIDAAIAGTDSLVLVDEAHLARHLMELPAAARSCFPAEHPVLPGGRDHVTVVSLSATGGLGIDRFDLTPQDLHHPTVRQRISTPKPLQIVETASDSKRVDGALASEVIKLLNESATPRSCIVFCNQPATARKVADRLRSAAFGGVETRVVVLTGRFREREADAARRAVLDPEHGLLAGAAVGVRTQHLVVVATQTLEVGADLDAELMVTETCGVRALTQRLGRLNRLGLHQSPQAVLVHPKPGRDGWPVYADEPATVVKRLTAAMSDDGSVDLCPERVAEVLGEPGDDPGRAPVLLPALLWEWLKTTTPPPGEAPVEPYFAGIERPDLRVSIVWRAYLPTPGESLWPRISDAETVDIPMSEIRGLLSDTEVFRLDSERSSIEAVTAAQLRPGDVLVMPSDWGHYDDDGWSADVSAPVLDVSLLDAGLPLDPEALGRFAGWRDARAVRQATAIEDLDTDELRNAGRNLISRLRELARPPVPEGLWSVWLDGLDPTPIFPIGEVPRLQLRSTSVDHRLDARDELSLASVVDLEQHGRAVGSRTRATCSALGIAPELTAVVAQAARFHDVGKADKRFQRWLDPRRTSTVPIAKSSAPLHRWQAQRIQAGWPAGGRHEALSGRLVQAWLADNPQPNDVLSDLLIHLVVSHHGHARPLIAPTQPSSGTVVEFGLDGTSYAQTADLGQVDWEQPRRFRLLNHKYGPWGLALLESIVRRSDHAVSAGGWHGEVIE